LKDKKLNNIAVGDVGFHSSTQPTDINVKLMIRSLVVPLPQHLVV
jgi:hypothetical protein